MIFYPLDIQARIAAIKNFIPIITIDGESCDSSLVFLYEKITKAPKEIENKTLNSNLVIELWNCPNLKVDFRIFPHFDGTITIKALKERLIEKYEQIYGLYLWSLEQNTPKTPNLVNKPFQSVMLILTKDTKKSDIAELLSFIENDCTATPVFYPINIISAKNHVAYQNIPKETYIILEVNFISLNTADQLNRYALEQFKALKQNGRLVAIKQQNMAETKQKWTYHG